LNRDELSARVGELRRLTFMYCDVVGSTELSGRQDPETYRELMRHYRDACREVIENRFEGHIVHIKGDGVLSTFGFPVAHENDAERAVRAGLDLVRAVRDLSRDSDSTAGELLEVRIGVHHGPVYLDVDEDDIYGLAANVGARLQTLAEPGTVVISQEVRELVEEHFEIEARDPQPVKGVAEPLQPFRVIGDRSRPPDRSWSTPLVEREEELVRLRLAWTRAQAGDADRMSALLVSGDAGVGKSRLLSALIDEVSARNGAVIELHGSPFHVDAGLHPVRSLIEGRCGVRDDTEPAERVERLAREVTELDLDPAETVPLLAPVLGIAPSAGYEPAAAEGRKLEERIAKTALTYIVACSGGRPAIVVAENVHWFDASTRDLLDDLVRAGPGTMLLVATSRDREDGPWEAIELRPLTLEGRLAVIDALEQGMSEQDRLALAGRSDGIPLYLEELVRAGTTHQAVDDPTAPVPGSVPAALYEPLVARLYSTPAALPVAAAAAAAGQEVDRALLAATLSLPEEELDSTLRDLVEGQILVPIAGRVRWYEFRHELLREVAYELQPPSWRRKVHSRLCDFLTREEPGDWRVLASHFERAERNYEAAVAYQHTAEAARRRGALEEARAHLTRAIELALPLAYGVARDHLEVQLRLRRGFLAMSTEGAASAEASADFDRCLELAAEDPQGDDAFATLISTWSYYVARADLDRARQVSETLRAALTGERFYFRPQNRASFAMLDWWAGNFGSAVEALATAVEELSEMGPKSDISPVWFVPGDPTVAMYVHLALARFTTGDLSAAGDSLARGRAVAASRDFPQAQWSEAYANWLGFWIWIEAGRLDLAREATADLGASSARHGFDIWEMIAATHGAVLDGLTVLRSGAGAPASLSEHAEAIAAYIEFLQSFGLRVFVTFYLTTIGVLLAASGDVEAARERFQASLRLAAESRMRFYDAETIRHLAHLAPNRDAMVGELRTALALARAQGARPFELRIALDLHELVGDEARPLLEEAMCPFENGAVTAELEAARARLAAAS
jgi:class 3 adenylate cyclase/tetratricopeptide (TPR) repeat protein